MKVGGNVMPYNEARERFENSLYAVFAAAAFDVDVQPELEDAKITEYDWFVSKTTDDGVLALSTLEDNIRKFRQSISERYRKVFEDRQKGLDQL